MKRHLENHLLNVKPDRIEDFLIERNAPGFNSNSISIHRHRNAI